MRATFAEGLQIAQLQPASPTTFETLVANNDRDGPRIEVLTIIVANVSAGTQTFRLCHDVDGDLFDLTTALFWDVEVLAGESWVFQSQHVGGGLHLGKQGNMGFYASSTDLICTVYGVSAAVQGRERV